MSIKSHWIFAEGTSFGRTEAVCAGVNGQCLQGVCCGAAVPEAFSEFGVLDHLW